MVWVHKGESAYTTTVTDSKAYFNYREEEEQEAFLLHFPSSALKCAANEQL